jgi:hypothetical protein
MNLGILLYTVNSQAYKSRRCTEMLRSQSQSMGGPGQCSSVALVTYRNTNDSEDCDSAQRLHSRTPPASSTGV